MVATAVSARPRGLALMLGWRHVVFTLSTSMGLGLLISLHLAFPVVIEPVILDKRLEYGGT